ncbi:DNA helicase PcrA [Nocardioides marmoriginsengisoli]|uniref:ATP-dependent DNA helicase n=1 Tax=Nocardioides marmoriginsengisoli TaxID=661483 RepID=A0A3N0CPX6_9ACTN|nr:DNA helicase PcrA [Nocardioides marmoriginsengisoli]RNL65351.1 DNA helicase PcrA [Nocardioides marmoriginsengisoli]
MSMQFPIPGLPSVEAADVPPEQSQKRRRPSRDELLEGLNEPQWRAVVHEGAPLLVVAGAGSGKTRVLTRRIAWLISERNAHPGSVLAITFTNKAAAEMRERVEELVGGRAKIMWVSTFHSACVRILRKESANLGFKSNFTIYDAADSKRLMTLVCRDLDLDVKRYQPRAILNWISNAKNELQDADEAARDAENDQERTYAEAYKVYQDRLRQANALDFDDLLMMTVVLFRTFREVRENWRRRFRHVLVDEYQDTNHAQYALIHELCGNAMEDLPDEPGERVPGAELMVVGDADQSIYAFRGANIRNIMDFEQDFPNAETVLLEQNYRSTQTILTAANSVIGNNQGRTPKRLWSDAGDGAKIVGYVGDDERDEARFVAEEIDKLTDEGEARAGDVAVFYRTNAQSRVFEEVFIRVGMPYKVVGGVRFYERKEVRDALAYLRTLVNPADQVSLRRILNTPKRGIGDRAEACVDAFASRERITFWEGLQRAAEAPGIASRSLNAITAFVEIIEQLQQMVEAGERVDVVLEQALTTSGYLKELEESDDPQDETRVENLAELVAVAREFADDPQLGPSADPADADPDAEPGDAPAPGLIDFLERVSLVADSDQIPDAPEGEEAPGMVTMMTLHTAKGLEFPVVFLTGLEDGVFPHMRSLGDKPELEEERRLAYVGLTRARQRLYVSRAIVRSAWGAPSHNPASRFIDELPVDLVDWRRTAAEQTSWVRQDLGRGSGAAYSGQLTGRGRQQMASRFSSATASADASKKAMAARDIPNLDPGDRVTHDTFGLGTVVSVEGVAEKAVASIDFGADGVKRLLLRYAPVEKL